MTREPISTLKYGKLSVGEFVGLALPLGSFYFYLAT
jgi:hypothetical protein